MPAYIFFFFTLSMEQETASHHVVLEMEEGTLDLFDDEEESKSSEDSEQLNPEEFFTDYRDYLLKRYATTTLTKPMLYVGIIDVALLDDDDTSSTIYMVPAHHQLMEVLTAKDKQTDKPVVEACMATAAVPLTGIDNCEGTMCMYIYAEEDIKKAVDIAWKKLQSLRPNENSNKKD